MNRSHHMRNDSRGYTSTGAGAVQSTNAVEPDLSTLRSRPIPRSRDPGRIGGARTAGESSTDPLPRRTGAIAFHVLSELGGLKSDRSWERIQARHALESLGHPAVPYLVDALSSPEKRLRWEAAKTLATIGDPAAAPALVAAMEDDDSSVRWVAAEALIALKAWAVVPVLRGLVARSDSTSFREGAHHVLSSLRGGALESLVAPVLSALEGLSADFSAAVSASEALDVLTRTPRASHAAPPRMVPCRGSESAETDPVSTHTPSLRGTDHDR